MAWLPEMLFLAGPAFLQRFQHDKEAPLVQRGISTCKSGHRVDRRICHHNLDVTPHLLGHGLERHVLGPDYTAPDAPGILLREETLRDHDIEIRADPNDHQRQDEYWQLVHQYSFQHSRIGRQYAIEHPFADSIKDVVPLVLLRRPQELRAHRRGRGE